MKERPILFSTEMVRAILDGRKTETRRVINPQPKLNFPNLVAKGEGEDAGKWKFPHEGIVVCPYGSEGDLLYVRESYCPRYFDDGSHTYKTDWTGEAEDVVPEPKWKPSIHMPKKASRIWLRVKEVSVERVQDINGNSAVAEGISLDFHDSYVDENQVNKFQELWNSINADRGYGWDENPFVWVVKFGVVRTSGKPKIENGILWMEGEP